MSYYDKYMKYKMKYTNSQNIINQMRGGAPSWLIKPKPIVEIEIVKDNYILTIKSTEEPFEICEDIKQRKEERENTKLTSIIDNLIVGNSSDCFINHRILLEDIPDNEKEDFKEVIYFTVNTVLKNYTLTYNKKMRTIEITVQNNFDDEEYIEYKFKYYCLYKYSIIAGTTKNKSKALFFLTKIMYNNEVQNYDNNDDGSLPTKEFNLLLKKIEEKNSVQQMNNILYQLFVKKK